MLLRIVVLLLIVLASPLLAQTRHALVVGIDRYDHIPSLQKARNDARAVAGALERAGFRVETLLDADRRTLLSGLVAFAQRLQPGDEVVFFFAGHGVEANGRNFLLPADLPALRPGDEVLLDSDGLPVDRVLSVLTDRGVRAAVLILDACRNNPFPQQAGRSLGGTRGLVPLSPPVGTMVVFSAGKGQEALDRLSDTDPDPNSVFTRRLLPLLTEPGLALHEAARRLRGDVEELAATVRHAQRPAVYDEMRGDFVLVPAAAPPAPVATAPVAPAPAAPAPADPCFAARQDWDLITREPAAGAAVLSAFLTAHANCPTLAALAQDRLSRLQAAPAPVVEAPAPAPADAPPAAPQSSDRTEQAARTAAECRRLTSPASVSFVQLERRNVEDTVSICRSALEWYPDDPHLMALLGRALEAATRYADAYSTYRDSAEKGNPLAMTSLAFMLDEGKGVDRNPQQASRWLLDGLVAGSGLDSTRVAGMSPATVTEIQRRLSALGLYPYGLDGIPGPATMRALGSFVLHD
jgi:hypothetical protein